MMSVRFMFEKFREDISDVNDVHQLNEQVLTALWTTSIHSTLEALREQNPDYTEHQLIKTARAIALKHFDNTLLAAHDVITDEI
jgi:hypothetical protein